MITLLYKNKLLFNLKQLKRDWSIGSFGCREKSDKSSRSDEREKAVPNGIGVVEDEEGNNEEESEEDDVIVEDRESGGFVISDFVLLEENSFVTLERRNLLVTSQFLGNFTSNSFSSLDNSAEIYSQLTSSIKA